MRRYWQLAVTEAGLGVDQTWQLMSAGAADVTVWRRVPPTADDITARIDRVHQVTCGHALSGTATADGRRECAMAEHMRELVEVGAFTNASVLIEGESGTGKELLAQLVHELDLRRQKGDFVILDCAAITPELSGSEFFGHERGAFTGAVNARDGAFALANGGTLFLDEVGELPLTLQAQLLRVVQEHSTSGSGATRGSAPSSGSSARPTATCWRASPRDGSAPISITASPAGSATCRRCASGPRTSCR